MMFLSIVMLVKSATQSRRVLVLHLFFFFNDTATTEIYTLSLHDALPISGSRALLLVGVFPADGPGRHHGRGAGAHQHHASDHQPAGIERADHELLHFDGDGSRAPGQPVDRLGGRDQWHALRPDAGRRDLPDLLPDPAGFASAPAPDRAPAVARGQRGTVGRPARPCATSLLRAWL